MGLVVSEDPLGDLYYVDSGHKTLYIKNIIKGVEILLAFPDQIAHLKHLTVIFNEKVDGKTRDVLLESMMGKCKPLTTLHLTGFHLANFHPELFKKSGMSFQKIVPNLMTFVLEASNMPHSELSSVVKDPKLESLSLVHPSNDMLSKAYGHPIGLRSGQRLKMVINTIPEGGLHYPINMETVTHLDISFSAQTKMGIKAFNSSSATWKQMESLAVDVPEPYSIDDIRDLLAHMPHLTSIGIGTIKQTIPSEFRNFLCNRKYKHLIEVKMGGYGTINNRKLLKEFLQIIDRMGLECGKLHNIEDDSKDKPYFHRTSQVILKLKNVHKLTQTLSLFVINQNVEENEPNNQASSFRFLSKTNLLFCLKFRRLLYI